MGELIVTIRVADEGSPFRPGLTALEHLVSRPMELGCDYVGSLQDHFAPNASADAYSAAQVREFLDQLPFSFHRLRTEPGRELAAALRIREWHRSTAGRWPRGLVEGVELNVPLYPLPPLGLPFKLGADHGSYVTGMGVRVAHGKGVSGAGVRVAVLDSGVQANTVPVTDFFDVDNVTNLHPVPPAPYDNDGHGTAMAELIHDVAPGAEVYAVRVFDTVALNLWNLQAGAAVAMANCEADIISVSLGHSLLPCALCGAQSAVQSLAFERLIDAVVPRTGEPPVVVAAAGNSTPASDLEFPAALANCVAVGSVDSTDAISSFSCAPSAARNWHLVAPGGQQSLGTFTEYVGNGGGSNRCAGTSVSAAYVSGIFALCRSERSYSGLDRATFIQRMLANHCRTPAGGGGRQYGAGIVQY